MHLPVPVEAARGLIFEFDVVLVLSEFDGSYGLADLAYVDSSWALGLA